MIELEVGWLRRRPMLICWIIVEVWIVATRCRQVFFIEFLRLHHHVGRWRKTLERIERLCWNLLFDVDAPARWRWRWRLVRSGRSARPVLEVMTEGGDV